MNPAVPSSAALIVKLVLSLGLVVGLILVLQKAARKWGHTLGAAGGPEAIRLLSQRSVGPRLSLAVVEVRGRTLLVGISPQGIHAVADLDTASVSGAAPPLTEQASPGSGSAGSFDPGLPLGGRGFALAAPGAGVAAAERSAAAAPSVRGLLQRWGLRSRGAASFAPVPGRPSGPPRGGTAGGSAPHRGSAPPAVFEDELLARLASLRDRYPSLADLEADVRGGVAMSRSRSLIASWLPGLAVVAESPFCARRSRLGRPFAPALGGAGRAQGGGDDAADRPAAHRPLPGAGDPAHGDRVRAHRGGPVVPAPGDEHAAGAAQPGASRAWPSSSPSS